jgi:hypothetical protein
MVFGSGGFPKGSNGGKEVGYETAELEPAAGNGGFYEG